MSKNTALKISIIGGIGLMAYGLYSYFQKQLSLAMGYCYKIKDFSLKKVALDKIEATAKLKFLNKSYFDIFINGYNLNIFINGRKVGNVMSDEKINIAPTNVSEIPMNIIFEPDKKFNLKDAILLISYFSNDKSKVIIQVIGDLNAKMNFIAKTIPVNVKMTLEELLTPSDKPDQDCNI